VNIVDTMHRGHMTIRLLLVDDHPVFADALQARLSAEADLDPVLIAYSVGEARATLAREEIDVLVLDQNLGDGLGTDLLSHMRDVAAKTHVVILSGVHDVALVVDAVVLGVRGWVTKRANVDELMEAIRVVYAGHMWLAPDLLSDVVPALLRRRSDSPPGPLEKLTPRERQVLACMVEGLSGAEIDKRLRITRNTVRTHTQNLITKLGVHSSLEAVAIALRSST
jgi:DNA-binding NarL/FixJ family response regulator